MKSFLEIQSESDEKFLFRDLQQAKDTITSWTKTLDRSKVGEFLDVLDRITQHEIKGPFRNEVLAFFDSVSMSLTKGRPRVTEEEYEERTVFSGQSAIIEGRERSNRHTALPDKEVPSNIIRLDRAFIDI